MDLEFEDTPIEELQSKRGWLKKKSPIIGLRWHWRYFVLENKVLSYYRHEDSRDPNGVINLDQVKVDVQIADPPEYKRIAIVPEGSNEVFDVYAETHDEMAGWVQAILEHVQQGRAYQSERSSMRLSKESFRMLILPEDDFLKQATTGDILLYKTSNVGGRLQRHLIHSKYDHIALLLKFNSTDLAIFEATHPNGVQMYFWSDFLMYGGPQAHAKVVYRQLIGEKTPHILQRLNDFVRKVRGRKYRISARKFLKGQNCEPGNETAFFCSELVCSAYKYIGILPMDILSYHYLPKHFSSARDLPFNEGYSFGPEMLLEFNSNQQFVSKMNFRYQIREPVKPNLMQPFFQYREGTAPGPFNSDYYNYAQRVSASTHKYSINPMNYHRIDQPYTKVTLKAKGYSTQRMPSRQSQSQLSTKSQRHEGMQKRVASSDIRPPSRHKTPPKALGLELFGGCMTPPNTQQEIDRTHSERKGHKVCRSERGARKKEDRLPKLQELRISRGRIRNFIKSMGRPLEGEVQ